MKARWQWLFLPLIGWMIAGCADERRLVVYCDPWLQAFGEAMVADFRLAEPAVDVEVRYLSSEVIAQHLEFGQPMDVVLCYGCKWMGEQMQDPAQRVVLAPSAVVEIRRIGNPDSAKQARLGTVGRLVVEASDRPSRRYAERDLGLQYSPSRHMIANFHPQVVDYLQRGWAEHGIVPIHFALQAGGRYEVVRYGVADEEAFTALVPRDAPHPAWAAVFLQMLQSEKSREKLVSLDYLH